jgi:predicted nucleic acid-binding protein
VITAVDSSVLLDVLTADRKFGPSSRDALRRVRSEGATVACDIVWAEVTGWFADRDTADAALDTLGITYVPLSREAAAIAGEAWREYREGGGARDRVVADFLIGAHALTLADRLLTRDRGFQRRYFRDLVVIDPSREEPK